LLKIYVCIVHPPLSLPFSIDVENITLDADENNAIANNACRDRFSFNNALSIQITS